MNDIEFSSSEAQLAAEMCFEEARKLRRRSSKQQRATKERRNARRSENESLNELPKSCHGAAKSAQRAPGDFLKSFLGTKMELGEAQNSSAEASKSLENDVKIKDFEVHGAL